MLGVHFCVIFVYFSVTSVMFTRNTVWGIL